MTDYLGYIGGSGLYDLDFLEDIKYHDLTSSFGNPSDKIIEGKIDGNIIFFYLGMGRVTNCHHLQLIIGLILIVLNNVELLILFHYRQQAH